MEIFLKYYLKYIVMVAAFIVAITVIGAQCINLVSRVEEKSSSYTRTTFDYYISSPDAAQAEKIESDPSVEKVFPFYSFSNAFTQSASAKEVLLLMSDDMEDSDISLFTDATLIEGKYDAGGIMLDYTAAQKLKAGVGDSLTFNFRGKTFTRKVAGLYLASTYGALKDGIALASFTDDLKALSVPKFYGGAFLKSNDKQLTQTLLADYVGEGNVTVTFEEYASKNSATPGKTLEEMYKEYHDEIIESARRGGGQVVDKAVAYADIKDNTAADCEKINTFTISAAAASAALFLILGIVFICTNYSNDFLNSMSGRRFIVAFGQYFIITLLSAAAISGISFGILYLVAAKTFFLESCMKVMALCCLPVLAAASLVILFAFIHLRRMYITTSKI